MKNKIILCTLLAIFSFSCCFSAEINTSGPPISPIGAKLFGKSSAGSVGWIKSVDTVVPVVGVSPAADTAAINAALLGGNKHVLISKDVTIDAPMVIYSNTYLEIYPGVTVSLLPSVGSGHMLVNRAAYSPQRSITDGAITAGDATFYSEGANFTFADVGRTVVITGAGWGLNGTGPGPFVANILSVTDEGAVELSNTAKQTVTGASVSIYDRDKNIKLTGGFFERGSVSGSNLTTNTLFLRHIDGLIIEDQRHHSSAGKYTYAIGDVTKVNIGKIDFNVHSDGVHITGPAHDVTIRDITGYCADDMVPIMNGTGANDVANADVQGDISNLTVENILGYSGTSSVKLLGGKDYTIVNARINNIKTTNASNIGVFLMDDVTYGIGQSMLRNITIDGVEVPASNASVFSNASSVSNLTINNVKTVTGQTGHGIYVSGGVVEDLVINGLCNFGVALGSSKYLLNIADAATLKNTMISNLVLNPGNTNTGGILYSGDGGKLSISNFEAKGPSGTLLNLASTANLDAIAMLNGDLNASGGLLTFAKNADLELTNVRVANLASTALFYSSTDAANLTLRGDRINFSDSTVYKWWGLNATGNTRQAIKSFIENLVNPPQVPLYSSSKTYATGNVVFVNSGAKYFESLQNNNINHAPPTSDSDAYWNLLSSGSTQRLTNGGAAPLSAAYNNDIRGYIAMGTGSPTTITVQFNTAFTNAPHVTIMPVGNTQPVVVAATTTGFTASSSAAFTGFSYKVDRLN